MQWVQHVLSHLGGKRLAEPDDENIYIPEKADYNKKVMSFIQAYILQPPVWMFDEKLTAKLEINGSREFDRLYEELMSEKMCIRDRYKSCSFSWLQQLSGKSGKDRE